MVWTSDDRDKVFAWQIRESKRCPTCRQFADDWQDPETKRRIDPSPLNATSWYCEPCAQLDKARDDKPDRPGVSVRFVAPKVDVVEESTL